MGRQSPAYSLPMVEAERAIIGIVTLHDRTVVALHHETFHQLDREAQDHVLEAIGDFVRGVHYVRDVERRIIHEE